MLRLIRLTTVIGDVGNFISSSLGSSRFLQIKERTKVNIFSAGNAARYVVTALHSASVTRPKPDVAEDSTSHECALLVDSPKASEMSRPS